MFTTQEKELLKYLIKKEIECFEKDESTIRPEELSFLEEETKYDIFLNQLLKKIEK